MQLIVVCGSILNTYSFQVDNVWYNLKAEQYDAMQGKNSL